MPLDYAAMVTYIGNTTAHSVTVGSSAYSIILSALQPLQKRYNWQNNGNDVSDAEWDIIEAWVAGAYDDLFTDVSGGDSMPIGSIIMLATASVPSGYLLCDGSQYLRTAYPDLYAALDSAFIVDADNFTVPDLRDTFALGSGISHNVGDTGGEVSHALTTDEMPAHSHTIGRASNIGTSSVRVAGGNATTLGLVSTSSVGAGDPHNNMPPYLALLPVIKAT
jgi:microcystin-dependent protein